MDVGVDHARQHRRRAEVDDARAGWNGHGGTNVSDAVASHQHDLVRGQRAVPAVEQPAGPDRDDLIPGDDELRRGAGDTALPAENRRETDDDSEQMRPGQRDESHDASSRLRISRRITKATKTYEGDARTKRCSGQG